MAFPLPFDKQREPKAGDLLLSEPFLTDQFFSRSVILMCGHNEEGSYGFILNIVLPEKTHEIINELPETSACLSIGGPVGNQEIFYLHNKAEIPNSSEIAPNLFIGGDFNELKIQLATGDLSDENIRFFIGYAGWTAGQLKEELEENAWLVITPDQQFDFFKAKQADLWKDLLVNMGGKFKLMSEFPENPNLN